MDGSSTQLCNGQQDNASVAITIDIGSSDGAGQQRKTAALMLKSCHMLSPSSVFGVEQNISVSACVSKILTDNFST